MTKAKKRTAKVWVITYPGWKIPQIRDSRTDARRLRDWYGDARIRIRPATLTWSEPAPKAKRSAR